ncbi:MAG: AAA family ATPase [Anaerolineae bacterium]|nr:AAA family ATPase [Anaerolineae bacterium]
MAGWFNNGTGLGGHTRAPARSEYTTFGDAVNTAAHIAMSAAWGEVWLDETAVPALKPLFALQPLGLKPLKRRHIPLYRLLAEAPPSPHAFFEGQMVGRQAELNQLLQAVNPVFHGRFAGLVAVHGEAGMGKSRLLAACRQQLAADGRWLECPADDILRQSLNPFRTMLRLYFHQSAQQSAAQNRAAFFKGLDELQQQLTAVSDPRATAVASELRRTQSLLAALVTFLPHSLYAQLEPKLRFENSLIALESFVQAQALCHPLLLHLADAHWLDSDSQDFLQRLLRRLDGYAAAIILSSRYGEEGGMMTWGVGAAVLPTAVPQTHIQLTALSAAHLHELCRQLLPQPASDDLVIYLQHKGSGNPLF